MYKRSCNDSQGLLRDGSPGDFSPITGRTGKDLVVGASNFQTLTPCKGDPLPFLDKEPEALGRWDPGYMAGWKKQESFEPKPGRSAA